jgi:choice-of-anchor C domain-containing protein
VSPRFKASRRLAAAAAALSLIAPASASAASELVTNGSFETPVVSGLFNPYGAGSSFGGWEVGGGGVDHLSAYWEPFDGNQTVDMSGSGAGTLSQTLNIASGTEAVLTFWLAGNPECGPDEKSISVVWNGNNLGAHTFNISGKSTANMGWVEVDETLAGTGVPTELQFVSNTESACGPVIDGVTVFGDAGADGDSVTGSGTIGSGQTQNSFVFDAFSDSDGDNPGGTIQFTQVSNPARQTNGDVVCLDVDGNRAVIIYEESSPPNPQAPGGIIHVGDTPDQQKNGRLTRRQLDAYEANGCTANTGLTLNTIVGGDITVVDA